MTWSAADKITFPETVMLCRFLHPTENKEVQLEDIIKFTTADEMVALCFVNKATSAPLGRQGRAILGGIKSEQ